MKLSRLKTYIFFLLLSVSVASVNVSAAETDGTYNFLQPAETFLHRYRTLLKASSSEENANLIRRTKEQGFRYVKGSDNVLKNVPDNADMSLEFSNGFYTASFSDNGSILVECSFPANVGLMRFSNKIELERQMLEKLKMAAGSHVSIKLPHETGAKLKSVPFSEFFVRDNGLYISPKLKNMLVFQSDPADTGSYVLLIDNDRYGLESLQNMMLTGYSPHPFDIDLKLRQYGYKAEEVSLDMGSLFKLFEEEGSMPYWGVKTFDGETVEGLYLWVNEAGGFIHLLNVTVPVSVVKNGGKARADLSCYIRTDNLKSLFADFPEL